MTREMNSFQLKQEQGFSLLRSGKLHEAKAIFTDLCHHDKNKVELWLILSHINKDLGVPDQALRCLDQARRIAPDNPLVHFQIGNLLEVRNQVREAAESFRSAIALKPDFVEAYSHLGLLLEANGELERAVDTYRAALAHVPLVAELHYNLGQCLHRLGKAGLAIASYNEALRIKPDLAVALNNLGLLYQELNESELAREWLIKATRANPLYAEAYFNLGNTLKIDGNAAEAIVQFHRAVELRPEYVKAWREMGTAYYLCNDFAAAARYYDRALELDPRSAETHLGLANVLLHQGKIDEAIATLRRALELEPNNQSAQSNFLLALHYSAEIGPEAIFHEHVRWGRQFGESIQQFDTCTNGRNPERRLRIGYVSPDFRGHSVARFFQPILTHHNTKEFEIYCYAEVATADAVTEHLKHFANHWRNTVAKTDRGLAEIVRDDKIDILVDLAGHTSKSRLRAFAYRPAPIMLNYLGYPDTTGLPAIDYRLTDVLADPRGSDDLATEALIRLPDAFLCFEPDADAPPLRPPPVTREGFITFGSFNALPKINRTVINAWAALLRTIPNARLIIKNRSFCDSGTRDRIKQMFDENGVRDDRINLVPWFRQSIEHLDMYNKIDIALDTFPYNGTTTTCEALWMGVPVVTLAGDRHACRVGSSLLYQVGLTELIAYNLDEYKLIVKNLATDTKRLEEFRRTLRNRLSVSLCDGNQFTQQLESTYREIWRRWCNASHGGSGAAGY